MDGGRDEVRKSKYMFLRRTMNHSSIGINYCYQLRLLVFGAMVLVLSPRQVKIEREVSSSIFTITPILFELLINTVLIL